MLRFFLFRGVGEGRNKGKMKSWRTASVVWFTTGALLGSTGCTAIRRGVGSALAPAASQISQGILRQEDLQLARDGLPAYLLLLDAFADAYPHNARVLLAAADAQLAYATAFVSPEDSERQRLMFQKARDYGLRVLARNRRFARAQTAPFDSFQQSLKYFRKPDAPALLTTAIAWLLWIHASSDSPAALGETARALALMDRVKELDSNLRHGTVDLFYGIYYTILPLGGGRDLEKARYHFERAQQVAGPDYLPHQVALAEFYARYALDAELFQTTLQRVINARPQRSEFALANAVARERARILLSQIEEWF